jgi:hypothetical protein
VSIGATWLKVSSGHSEAAWSSRLPGGADPEAVDVVRTKQLMVVKARKCYVMQLPTLGDSMNEEQVPECPDGHGEMVPAMGEVKKGEIRRIEQNWACETCGKIVRLPFL